MGLGMGISSTDITDTEMQSRMQAHFVPCKVVRLGEHGHQAGVGTCAR